MSHSRRRHRRTTDGDFPAYFTRHSVDSVGWPFIAALVAVLAVALIAIILSLVMA